MPRTSLKAVSGSAAGLEIALGPEPFLIGRSAGGDGRLGGDPELSRRHARILDVDGRPVIEDLGSTNGTFVNGRRIHERTPLRPGDAVEVGGTRLELWGPPEPEVTAARAAAPPPAADAPPPAAGASLRVVAGRASGTTIPLGGEPFAIGRGEEGAGRLGEDPELSRSHARVSRMEGRLVVEDLGSTNGTFVNGRRVPAPTVVEAGDAIWVGTTTLLVTTPEAPPPEVEPVEPPMPSSESGLLSRFAMLSDRHPRRILAAVGAFLVLAVAVGGPVATLLDAEDAFQDPGSESARVDDRIARATGEEAGPQLIALVRGGDVASDAMRRRVQGVAREIRRDEIVTRALSFYGTGDRSFVSRDGEATFVAAFFEDAPDTELEDATERIREEIGDRPGVAVGGSAVAQAQLQERVEQDLARAEALAFPILFALSLIVFRGVVAALLPMFVGVLTVFTTFFVLRLVNEVVALSPFALNVVIGLGLGLSIDYSLFVVSRYREELARVGGGRPRSRAYGAVPRSEADGAFAGTESEALLRSIYTAGRTILYSAVTVAIALAALIVFPQPFLYSMGIGGAACALVAVTVSLVALPALLAVLGPRVNALAPERWRRAAERTARREEEGPWYRLSRGVMRRPGLVAAASAALLIAVGIPTLGIEFTGVDSRVIPRDLSSRQVEEALGARFPANPSPEITVLAEAPRGRGDRVRELAQELRSLPGAARVAPEPRPLGDRLWEVPVLPARSPLHERTIDLVERIRDRRAPFPLSVGGQTAAFLDQRASIGSHLPIALLILGGTTLVVLFLMTGSVVLPLKSLLMNVLSLSAAFGLLVLIFQEGSLEGPLGFESVGALDLTQPVLLFAIAFGLSTDYAVFLLTRIKEARTAGASETDSVAIGLERTGRIVTQAAILFCVAIGAFATSSVLFIKEVGVGTALAVIIDASIIRAFLVPSLMALLGARNWWAPRPLRRLHERIGLSEG